MAAFDPLRTSILAVSFGRMKWRVIFLPLVAAFAMGQANEGQDIYLSVPHGSFPNLTKLQWQGKLPKTGDQVAVTFSLNGERWEILIDREGRPPIQLVLRATRLSKAHPELAQIWASYDEQELHLAVPYGEPFDDCFANGDDVFEDIQINVAMNGNVGAQDTRFVNCEAKDDDLPITLENGLIIIAN